MHRKAIILYGGVAHPYRETSEILKAALGEVGFESILSQNLNLLASKEVEGFDAIVLNCARWTCRHNPEWRRKWGYEMPEGNRRGLIRHLEAGKGLLCLHAAPICFDDWPEYRHILGAWWEWGESGHAPYGEYLIHVRKGSHPIVAGLEDFTIRDEIYTGLRVTDTIDPLMTAEWKGLQHPMLWTRSYRKGRVCYCALGHGEESFQNDSFRYLLQRAALWVTGDLNPKD